MPIATTPSLGISTNVNDGMVGGLPYYDSGRAVPSPPLGTTVFTVDGHQYVFAQASAAVASDVDVILTEPAMTFATGAGAWRSPLVTGGTASGGYAWIQKKAI